MNTLTNVKISVVMATYNHANYVKQAIDSVLFQKNIDFEFLIADDGSNDNTRDVISAISDPRIKFYPNEVNRGACIVTNELINLATGEYIAIINSDDYWSTPDKLAIQLNYMESNKNIGACFGRAKFIDKDGIEIDKDEISFGHIFDKENRTKGKWLRYFFENENCLCHPTVLIRKCCYEELGLYNNIFRQLPDFDMWIRLVKKYDIYVFDEYFINFRIINGENASSPIRKNIIRNMTEHMLIASRFFDNVDCHVFLDGFSDILINKSISNKYELEIEKLMLYFLENYNFGCVNKIIFLNKIYLFMSNNIYREILFSKYSIDDKWVQEFTGNFDFVVLYDLHDELNIANKRIFDLENSLCDANKRASDLDAYLTFVNKQKFELNNNIDAILNSNSWKITKPVRFISRLLTGRRPLVAGGIKPKFISYAKKIYYALPYRYRGIALKCVFYCFGSYFSDLPRYQIWKKSISFFKNDNIVYDNKELLLIDNVAQSFDLTGRIAIHLHMYYEDLADEFVTWLNNMPFKYDLYISVASKEGLSVCQQKFSCLQKNKLLVVEQVDNRGRDIAPMFCNFGSRLKNYDYIAHLHSKKSLYNNGSTEGWRAYLCNALLGDTAKIRKIFYLLQSKNQPIGIVYPQNYTLIPYFANTWLANKRLASVWCARLGIKKMPQGYFNFPAGSMFWARGDALKPIFESGININDFDLEQGQTDGTFAHCLERLLVLSSLKQGYQPGIIKDLDCPSWSVWRFDQYTNRSKHQIFNQMNSPSIKVIAFDVFDTLLCRPLLDPELTKSIVAGRIGGEIGKIYLQNRVKAENLARERAVAHDVNIEDIFVCLLELSKLSQNIINQLMALEEEVEQQSLSQRSGGMELYKQALSVGKPVILISDMFLPLHVIKKILQKNNILGWSNLYLSSDIGLRKDTGELYDYVISAHGIKPSQMLMIGDNERSDIQIPSDKGIVVLPVLKAVEFARSLSRFSYLVESNEYSNDLNDQLTLGLILQKNFSAVFYPNFDYSSLVEPTAFNLGYTVIGPLLLGFSQWLIDCARSDNIKHLYFLARDGQIIKEVYDVWSKGVVDNIRSDYLVLSRRSISIPLLKNFYGICALAGSTHYFSNTISNFLFERFGLELSNDRWDEIKVKLGWDKQSLVEVVPDQINHIEPLLKELELEILKQGERENKAINLYFESMELCKTDYKKAVVDVGYSGTIQRCINELLDEKVNGYYLMTNDTAIKMADKFNVIARGCYFEAINPDTTCHKMYTKSFLLEKFLSSDDGQLICYLCDDKLGFTSKYRELSNQENRCSEFRHEMRLGIMSFVDDAKNIRQGLYPNFKPSYAVAKQIYEAFINKESAAEAELCKQIVIDDHYCGRGVV